MKTYLLNVLTMIIIIALLPSNAFAVEMTVDVNADKVQHGDEIKVSGTASGIDNVTIKIVSPNQTVFYLDVLPVKEGTFSTSIGIPNDKQLVPNGTYTIIAGTNSLQDQEEYLVVNKKNEEKGKDKVAADQEKNADTKGTILQIFMNSLTNMFKW
ncbi:hypothetical protein [Bacillus sp. SA1-12]|uniref:hypothetical protein n=1 Tax=Bacillus sp. SA1-12 TaxID=1455638 RepID=UPI0012E0A4E1|nr:hypothetical protein [Bacillus sp. SA1-12]